MEEIPDVADEILTETTTEARLKINLDLEEAEEGSQNLRKCTKQYAQTVEKNAKYHSNHQESDQSTAETASPSIGHQDSKQMAIRKNSNRITGYRIVKYCRTCRKRFLVNKGESKKNYCDECEAKFNSEDQE